MKTTRLRPILIGTAALAWFLTLVGGWNDVGAAIAGAAPLPAALRQTLGVERALDTAREAGAAVGARTRGGEAAVDRAADPLVGRVLAEGDRFGLPTHLTVSGDELLLVDRYADHAILAIDRHTGATRRSFGPEGAGPGEFEAPMTAVVEDSRVAVLDAGLNRLTWIASSRDPPGFALAGTASLTIDAVATDAALADDGSYLLTGFMTGGRLARVTRDGGFVGYVGEPPDVADLPPERRGEVYQGTIRASPSHDRHVVTSRFASRIEVWNGTHAGPLVVWGPERFEPRPGAYETRFGYLDSAPTGGGFIGLYSGRTRSAFPGRANYASTLHVFDWQGRLRAVHRLGADVISIAWSEPDRRLYAIRHDPVPGVLVYRLE